MPRWEFSFAHITKISCQMNGFTLIRTQTKLNWLIPCDFFFHSIRYTYLQPMMWVMSHLLLYDVRQVNLGQFFLIFHVTNDRHFYFWHCNRINQIHLWILFKINEPFKMTRHMIINSIVENDKKKNELPNTYRRSTPPNNDAFKHSGGESLLWTSAIVTLYFDVLDRRLSRPGTEQNTSLGDPTLRLFGSFPLFIAVTKIDYTFIC